MLCKVRDRETGLGPMKLRCTEREREREEEKEEEEEKKKKRLRFTHLSSLASTLMVVDPLSA